MSDLVQKLLSPTPPPHGAKPSRPFEPTEPSDQPHKPTDDELGEQLMLRWGEMVKFIYGAWNRYAEGVWKPDAKMPLEFWQVLINNKRNGIKPNAGKASSIEKFCQLKAMVDDQDIDVGGDYINLKNGVFNLRTGELEEHRPDLYMTTQLDFEYDPDAICLTWLKFLKQVLVKPDGSPDWELQVLVQQAFYYSLTADTSYRVSFWLVGASGTGKSTLLNVLIKMAGDSHVAIDLDSLKDNQYQLADIAGKRVVTFTEPDSRAPLADGWYKRLVSKDTISARQAYGKPFNFVPICKVWGAMNDTPRVIDRSDAVFGRVVIVPMNRVVPANERDGLLDEKLLAELPGIFNWALVGASQLKRHGGFIQAHQSEEARDEYRNENDAEGLYISERCTLSPQLQTTNDDLYQDYKAWCDENGYMPKQKPRVGKDWKRLGLVQSKSGDGSKRIWKGIGLNSSGASWKK